MDTRQDTSTTTAELQRIVALPRLANELLDEILSYLGTADRNATLRTCWALHCVSARRLYQHVSVTNYKARRFFKTAKESKMNYTEYTRSLEYSASSNTDAWLTYVLLRDALWHLPYLESMTLTIRSELSSLLSYLIKKSTSPLALEEEADFETKFQSRSMHALESLRTLNIHGDLRMLKLFRFENLSRLCISAPMQEEDFIFFLYVASKPYSNGNTRLTDLTLTIDDPLYDTNITGVMKHLSDQFPNICTLVIRSPRINALKMSEELASEPPIFLALQEFWANDLSLIEPFIDTRSEDDIFAIQHQHISDTAKSHPNLTRVGFGPVIWSRISQSSPWSQTFHVPPPLVALHKNLLPALMYEVFYDTDS